MPMLEHWDVELELTVRVLDRQRPSTSNMPVLTFTTTGTGSGNSRRGLADAIRPALDQALADQARIADNFRRESRDEN